MDKKDQLSYFNAHLGWGICFLGCAWATCAIAFTLSDIGVKELSRAHKSLKELMKK